MAREYGEHIEDELIAVTVVHGADAALRVAAQREERFDAVVVDIRMPPGKATRGARDGFGKRTGLELTRLLLDHLPDAVFIALTTFEDAHVGGYFAGRARFGFALKRDYPPRVFARLLRRKLLDEKPRVFIVHGHDLKAARDLKSYLEQSLGFDDVVILQDQPSGSLTVIEKFEHYSDEADVVFALFTPDDFDIKSNQPRARQNVVFEYGYFLSRLGRRSGKVIMLRKGEVEIPSDLKGLLPIDISDGVLAAAEAIRRELREFCDEED